MLTDKKQKNTKFFIALLLVMILQLGRLVYSFVYFKEDFHSDEMWSFGLSNSYYQPYIYENADRTECINYKTWFSSQAMRDYLTVDESQRFTYGSVYYNQVHDDHPPLYYFILHTICSLFPDEFSPWYGFVINIIAFAGTLGYLYQLIFINSESGKTALIGCLFYGYSMGALNTFIFIRIYALATMISVMYLYYHAKLYHEEKMKKNMICLFLITLSGCLTHHFFVPFAGSVSACFCLYYLLKKKFKKLLSYSIIMIASVALSLMIFPATISHLFSGRIEDGKYPFIWQFKLTLSCLTSELFGFYISPVSKYSFTANLILVVCVLMILSPLCFLFRKEALAKKILLFISRSIKSVLNKVKTTNLMIIVMIVSSLETILLTALTVSYIHMGKLTDRYIFMAFPGTISLFVLTLEVALKKIRKKYIKDVLMLLICSCICVMTNLFGPVNYFFSKDEGAISVKDIISDSNCVFVSDDLWLMTCFTRLSMDAADIYAITGSELSSELDEIPDPPSADKRCYYFIEENTFFADNRNITLHGQMPEHNMVRDQSQKLTRLQFESQLYTKYSMCKYMGFDNMFERKFLIYRVN